MRNLYIDFDGVIMDTIPALYQYLKDNGINLADASGTDKSHDQFKKITELIAIYDFKKLLRETKPINDAFTHINTLVKTNKYNISILSHINSLEEGIAKVELLEQHLKGITIILVPKKLSKTKMVNSKEAILVDDYAVNLKEWEQAGGIGILFNQELENKGFPVLNDLSKIEELIG